jgi:energy-coupling factor transport system substrate-specific component
MLKLRNNNAVFKDRGSEMTDNFDKRVIYPKEINTSLSLALVPLGIALNLSIGTIVHMLKLPVYLDAVGTIIVTMLCGVGPGVATGVLSFILGGVLTNPVLPYFAGTQAAIAVFIYLVARLGGFRNWFFIIISGICLGIVAGVVSAPVIVKLFGGVTGSGTSLIVAYLIASGRSIMKSVILSGIASEPIDKLLQCMLAFWILRSIPKSMLVRFNSKLLKINRYY